jgi:hypothetical protein
MTFKVFSRYAINPKDLLRGKKKAKACQLIMTNREPVMVMPTNTVQYVHLSVDSLAFLIMALLP